MAGRLYPPILDYSMPAFALEGTDPIVRIYFTLPVYNSWSEIGSVHITVRYLDNNENALSLTYPARIKIAVPQIDETRITQQNKYYIEIASSDLAGGFNTGVIYKVQLRFSKLSLSVSGAGPRASWFNENYVNFSEWSTVTLIRPIIKPEFSVLGLEDANTGAAVNFASVDSVFTVRYDQGDDSEPLKIWRGRLYDNNKQLLADSGENSYNNYGYIGKDISEAIVFDIILPYQMTADNSYIFRLDILTRNGYANFAEYPFTCIVTSGQDFNGSISAQIDEEDGFTTLHITSLNQISNNLIIRRSSSESNFTIWEDINIRTFNGEIVDWTFYDFTIESGIWYRYGVQVRDIQGHRGSLTVLSDVIMGEFEHAFLFDSSGRQLKLKYDFNISNANITVSESKTDTIGSKFPYIRRNGEMYYRTFQCSGLITGYMDLDSNLFTTVRELYHDNQDRYNNIRNNIEQYVNQYDYTYEREFREKVQEFLYNDKVKLFRSLQEGNILVKLMNISLTPKNELGRLLYSFSCQAIEIDEPTLVNFDKYDLQNIGQYATSINFSEEKLGQLTSYINTDERKYIKANTNIIQEISKKFGWTYDATGALIERTALNNIIVNDFRLTYIKFEFESDPYLIVRKRATYAPFTGEDTTNQDLILGWLLQIGNDIILVQPPNNIYELKEEGLILNSNTTIAPLADTQMTIYYNIELDEELDVATVPVSTSYYEILGQLNRKFIPAKPAEDVVTLLSNKYSRKDGSNSYSLEAVFNAEIEAKPGTIIYARSSAMLEETKFIINETGNLLLDPGVSGIKIEQLHFEGIQIDIRYLDPLYNWNNQYHYDGTDPVTYFNQKHNCGFNKPATARDYDFYVDGSTGFWMFYNKQWCRAVQISDYLYEITCPVIAIVNYHIQQKKGVYQRN